MKSELDRITVALTNEKILDKPDTGPANLLAQRANAPKGIVDPAAAARRIRLATYPPCPALLPFVDYFWLVEWDLAGRPPQIQRVLPYPNAHLVFERGQSAIHGVVRGPFDRQVAGAGLVVGIRFKPGGLRPFIDQPLARLTGRTVPADGLLGMSTAAAEEQVLAQTNDQSRVAAATALLMAILPAVDARALEVAQVVAMAEAAGGPVSVAALASKAGIGERSLQRLFSEYVGVSPKWVIQRFRLQEAAWLLAQEGAVDLADLAARLGFFDQAHLTRDFTRLVGRSPLDYWKSQRA